MTTPAVRSVAIKIDAETKERVKRLADARLDFFIDMGTED